LQAAKVIEERREERREVAKSLEEEVEREVAKSLEEEVERLRRQWDECCFQLRGISALMKVNLSVAPIRLAAFNGTLRMSKEEANGNVLSSGSSYLASRY
jgi:hypothetical protein